MHSATRKTRLARRLLVAGIGATLSSAVASSALAGTKVFATGLMVFNGGVSVTTSCKITNYGKKAATITAVTIANQGGSFAASFDTCTSAPLAPDKACVFSGPANSVQGGGRALVKGSTKDLRGNCTLVDAFGNAVQFDQMR